MEEQVKELEERIDLQQKALLKLIQAINKLNAEKTVMAKEMVVFREKINSLILISNSQSTMLHEIMEALAVYEKPLDKDEYIH
jgi:hypothetical protein